VSGEFEEVYTAVNFARRLLNLSSKGMCIETTGRLREGVKLNVELRFEDLNGSLRSPARIMWVDTLKEGGQEVHKAGVWFVGPVEATQPVRQYLEGGRPEAILAQRRAEYQDLKQKSEARKQGAERKKWGAGKKLAVTLLVLALLYVGSFWGFVLLGQTGAPLRYRYLGSEGRAEEVLRQVYSPAHWAFRQVGVDLTYDPPPVTAP
jgi:hypothetical protein